MATYILPQARIHQEYQLAPSAAVDSLRAHISGPVADLHRYDVDAERPTINVGGYDRLSDTPYPWPGRAAGSVVDVDSVRVFIENALLMYLEDTIGDASGGRGLVTPVAGRKNYIQSSSISFKSNGLSWPRSGLLYDRDVQVGDVVHIRGVADAGGDCDEHELWTRVAGFAADTIAATVDDVINGPTNQEATVAGTSITQIAGDVNGTDMTAHGTSDYDGLASGFVEEVYTVEVVASSVSGCAAARLRVTSASGTDDVAEITPGLAGTPIEIGTRGLVVQFDAGDLVIGQVWEIEVSQDFEPACALSGGTYTGPHDDTYIVEVTKGGTWANLPEVTVTTTKGLDSSGPTTVSGTGVTIPVGTHGLVMEFEDCDIIDALESSLSLPGDTLAGLRKGDKFYITVTSGQNGPVKTLILENDLPVELQDATDLDLRLFIPKTIEVTKNRLSHPPLVNYAIEPTQLVLKSGITAYDAAWTQGGIERSLPVWSGVSAATTPVEYGVVHIEYREWLSALSDSVYFISGTGELDSIPGPLDKRNPLKYGVYSALLGSGGAPVGYTSVTDPNSLDAWQQVLARVQGREDVYNLVPLTNNAAVKRLYQAHVNDESGPDAGNWKGMVTSLQARAEKMIVGQSDADAQLLQPTSSNGAVVLATLEDNPDATGTQYTLLSVPAGNSGFLTYGVRAGDIVRYLFTIDAFGNSAYSEFVVDRVLSQNSLLLLAGYTAPIGIPQKVEIWRTQNSAEMAADIIQQAAAYGDSRVVATWPDYLGLGGDVIDGMFLSATIAGMVSGVAPHRPLTNVAVPGFDDAASRTIDLFSAAQLNDMAAAGVWIVTENRDGAMYVRHAVTTSTVDLNRREEMIRRNVDSISFVFRSALAPYIGRTNVTPVMLRQLRAVVQQTIKRLTTNGYTNDLGPQLISAEIAKDADGSEILRVHPLAADRVEIVLNITIPAPLNNLDLYLVI